MTKLGLYLAQKSVNKSEVARKTGLTKARMNELTLNDRSHLRAEELYLIALAIDVLPADLLDYLCEGLALTDSLKMVAEEPPAYGKEAEKKK